MKIEEIIPQLEQLFINPNNTDHLHAFLDHIKKFWIANIDWTKQKSLLEKIWHLTTLLENICSSNNINVNHIDLKLGSDNSEYFEIENKFSTGSLNFDMALRNLHPYLYALAPKYIDKNFLAWIQSAIKEHQHWFNGSFFNKTFGMVYIPSDQALDISFEKFGLTAKQWGLLFAAILLPIPMVSAEKSSHKDIKEICRHIKNLINQQPLKYSNQRSYLYNPHFDGSMEPNKIKDEKVNIQYLENRGYFLTTRDAINKDIELKKDFFYHFLKKEELHVLNKVMSLFKLYTHGSLLKQKLVGENFQFFAFAAIVFRDLALLKEINIKSLHSISINFTDGSNHIFLVINGKLPTKMTTSITSVQSLLKNSKNAYKCDLYIKASDKELDQLHMFKDTLSITTDLIPLNIDADLEKLSTLTQALFITNFESKQIFSKKYLKTFFSKISVDNSQNTDENLDENSNEFIGPKLM
jgi:hypothetical protein